MNKPVLFCYDGSDGSRSALLAAAELVTHPADAVVLAVWMPAVVSLVRAGSFLTAVPNEGEIDEQEAAFAKRIAEEGAADARELGYNASARIAKADISVVGTIGEIAQRDRRWADCLRPAWTRRDPQHPAWERLTWTLDARATAGADRSARLAHNGVIDARR